MKTEDFVGGTCPVCGKPLVYEEGAFNCFNNDSLYVDSDSPVISDGEVDLNREIICDNCGCHLIAWHYAGAEEEAYGPVADQGFGHCFMCGSALVWGNDFMRSDLDPDITNEDDDAILRECSCPGCGAVYSIYEPTVNEMKMFRYGKENEPEVGL